MGFLTDKLLPGLGVVSTLLTIYNIYETMKARKEAEKRAVELHEAQLSVAHEASLPDPDLKIWHDRRYGAHAEFNPRNAIHAAQSYHHTGILLRAK